MAAPELRLAGPVNSGNSHSIGGGVQDPGGTISDEGASQSESTDRAEAEPPPSNKATADSAHQDELAEQPIVGAAINGYAAPPEKIAAPRADEIGSFETVLQAGGSCDDCPCFLPTCTGVSRWYGYIGGLTMGRNMPNRVWTTYESGNNANQLQYFPGADWGGGVDTRIGYWLSGGNGYGLGGGCNSCGPRLGFEAVYWGLWGLDGQSSALSPTGALSTPIDLGFVDVGSLPASDYFDNAQQHRLTRNDEVHNVEINFLVAPCCDPCRRLQASFLAGVRYFRFTDGLLFNTVGGSSSSGDLLGNDLLSQANLNVNVQNNLIGFQVGSYLNYVLVNRFSIFAIPKIGIYGNHASAHSSLYRGDGVAATFVESGNRFDIRGSADSFAVLASIDVGFNWQFHNNWGIIGGYRVVGVSGIALADDQIPAFLAAESDWRAIDIGGDLILHGAFAGIEARF